jgi:hypothetical protein
MSKEKIQKKRIVIWTKEDRAGNEVAFASIDLRAPAEPVPTEHKSDPAQRQSKGDGE